MDVFFVISGYLITGLLSAEITRTGKVDFVRFYARRIRRLLPAVFTMTLVTLAAGAAILSPLEFVRLGKSAIATACVCKQCLVPAEFSRLLQSGPQRLSTDPHMVLGGRGAIVFCLAAADVPLPAAATLGAGSSHAVLRSFSTIAGCQRVVYTDTSTGSLLFLANASMGIRRRRMATLVSGKGSGELWVIQRWAGLAAR